VVGSLTTHQIPVYDCFKNALEAFKKDFNL
jgi:hypothetical protein